jgi:putative phage-type endonuclease
MQIINVEQGTPEWLQMRLGKITGTRLKAVMGGKQAQETLIYELVAEQLSGQGESLYVNSAMQWGTDHEDAAVDLWEKRTKKKSEVVGFCVSDEFPYLALSPDRLVKKGKKYTGAVEVKCPTTKTVIKYMLAETVPSEYKWQVVNYFLVCEDLKELDFVVYDPRIIKDKKKLTVITVTRKDVDSAIDEARERLVQFRKDWEAVYKKVSK